MTKNPSKADQARALSGTVTCADLTPVRSAILIAKASCLGGTDMNGSGRVWWRKSDYATLAEAADALKAAGLAPGLSFTQYVKTGGFRDLTEVIAETQLTPTVAQVAAKVTSEAKPVTAVSVRPQGTKLCKRCGEVKPTLDFASNKSAKDGSYHMCKVPCERDYNAARAAAKKATAAEAPAAPAPAPEAPTATIPDGTPAGTTVAKGRRTDKAAAPAAPEANAADGFNPVPEGIKATAVKRGRTKKATA